MKLKNVVFLVSRYQNKNINTEADRKKEICLKIYSLSLCYEQF